VQVGDPHEASHADQLIHAGDCKAFQDNEFAIS
jgi:hypothetical protein